VGSGGDMKEGSVKTKEANPAFNGGSLWLGLWHYHFSCHACAGTSLFHGN
jgi:hypothetical protein